MTEQTKTYKGHLVSSSGKIYGRLNSLKHMKGNDNGKGYLVVTVDKKSEYVHRIVATCFLPNPENLPCINHIDKDRTNNSVSNLEWCTYDHNNEHSCAKTYKYIDPNGEVREIFNLAKFCKAHGLGRTSMRYVASGLRKEHKGWKTFK